MLCSTWHLLVFQTRASLFESRGHICVCAAASSASCFLSGNKDGYTRSCFLISACFIDFSLWYTWYWGEKWSFVVCVLTRLLKENPTNQVRLELKMLKKTNPEVLDSCFPPCSKLPSSPQEVISSFRINHLLYFVFLSLLFFLSVLCWRTNITNLSCFIKQLCSAKPNRFCLLCHLGEWVLKYTIY